MKGFSSQLVPDNSSRSSCIVSFDNIKSISSPGTLSIYIENAKTEPQFSPSENASI